MVELKKIQTMMGKIRKYLYLLFLSVLCVMSSCDKNEEDSRSLTGTVWIHQFASEDNVIDGSAAALYFGEETVKYYALDDNLKVLRLIENLPYRVVGQKLTIGIREGVLGDNYLTFNNERYYRSNKKITDMLTPQNCK